MSIRKASHLLIVPILALCAGWGRLAAQHPDLRTFNGIQSVGPLPADMHDTQHARYLRRLSALGIPSDDPTQEAARQFVRSISHTQDQIMLGGKISYGDPVSTYLNRLKDYILRDDPALRQRITVYLYRFPRSNAFAVGTDAIIVTTAMMATVSNEASIAFTLCHEIAHLKHQHAKNRYFVIENEKRKASENMFDWMKVRNIYNRAQEFEADREGFFLYRTTQYGCRDVYTAFDDMAYPNDFHNRHLLFDKAFFETPDQRFDRTYVLNPVDSIIPNEYEDDSEESHPSIRKRRSAIAQLDEANDCDSSNPFVVSEEQFRHAQELARFEQVNAHLQDARYTSAIFQAYLLLKVHPGNMFLRRAIATSLHCLFDIRVQRDGIPHNISFLEDAGEFQRADHFFQKLDLLSLGLLSVRWSFETWRDAPDDQHLLALWQHDMRALFAAHPKAAKSMRREPAPDSIFAPCHLPTDSLWAVGPNDERLKMSRMNQLEAFFLLEGETVTNAEGDEEQAPADSLWLQRRLHAWASALAHPRFDSTYKSYLSLPDTLTMSDLDEMDWKQKKQRPKFTGPIIALSPSITYLQYKKGQRHIDPDRIHAIDSIWTANLQQFAASRNLQIKLLDLNEMAPSDTNRFRDFHAIQQFHTDQSRSTYNVRLSRYWQRAVEACQQNGSSVVFIPTLWYSKRKLKLDALDYVLLVVAAPIYGPILLVKALFPEQHSELMYDWYDLSQEGHTKSDNIFGRGKLNARAIRKFADSAVQDLAKGASSGSD